MVGIVQNRQVAPFEDGAAKGEIYYEFRHRFAWTELIHTCFNLTVAAILISFPTCKSWLLRPTLTQNTTLVTHVSYNDRDCCDVNDNNSSRKYNKNEGETGTFEKSRCVSFTDKLSPHIRMKISYHHADAVPEKLAFQMVSSDELIALRHYKHSRIGM